MSEREHPHLSYRVWQRIANRDYHKVLPGLRIRKKSDWIVPVALIALGLVIGGSVSLQAYRYANRPIQVFGVCPPPAYIQGNGCFEVVHVTVNGQIVKNVTEPCGPPLCYYVYLTNGTKYQP